MKKATEQRTVLTVEGKIVRVNILEGGKSIEIYTISDCTPTNAEMKEEKSFKKNFDEKFPIVKASTLSLNDAFLKHIPQTPHEERIKQFIIEGIEEGFNDFRRPVTDLLFQKNEEKLEVIEYGNEEFKKIMSQRKKRKGSQKEFCAYLGLLIKHFMEKGYTEDEAWEKACELWKTSFGSTGIAVEDQNSSCGLSYIGDDQLNDYPKWLVFEV